MRIEDLPIPKIPYLKGKSFDPSPVVTHGIPAYADKLKDPRVEGTPEYEKWWTEQLYRCINGYQTGGFFIPGRFYYYMNFNSMSTIHGIINPDYCDMHLQLAYAIEWCKANNKNIVIGKKRRAGVSEAFQKMVIDYGYRFQPAYHGGIAAGKKVYADDFMTKWEVSESLLVPEFKLNALLSNDDLVASGYEVLEDGKTSKRGINSELYVRTMHSNPNMFKGLYLNDCIVEEAGEFENFDEFYSATKDCLKDGDMQVGIMYIFGTGGNINKGSKDFKKVWENPDDYNAVKFCITGDRFKKPYYGGATRYGKDITKLPYLSKKYKPYQLLGCEDTQAALEDILKEREILKKGELKKYLEHLQNNPINESEIFRKMFSNNFDIQKLNEQQDAISLLKTPKYSKYRLEWILDAKGLRTGKVKAIPLVHGEDDSETVLILDGYHPILNYNNLYVAGCDPYDQDEAKSSKSLGGMCVLIRKNMMGGLQMAPVATICTRPKRKEAFFDMCLKLAVYYNIVGNVLGDKAGSSGIIQWFKDNGCQKYLALRPTKFESENSEQSHEYWVSMNKTSKPMMIGLMQTNIYDFCQNIWFPELINQLGNYDEVEIGSDNDLADAYGIALMQDVSVNIAPRDNSFREKNNPFVLPGWEYNKEGILVPSNSFKRPSNPEKDFEHFGMSNNYTDDE
jgi:hypothetical protein